MKRLNVLISAAALAGLTACAASPEVEMTTTTKRTVTPPGGVWEVTAAEAAGPSAFGQSPYLGQRLSLAAGKAGDPAGRMCPSPMYQGWEAPAETILGGKPGEERRPIMDVNCGGADFGSYVGMLDGSLKTRVNDWVLTLKRAAPESDKSAMAPAPMQDKPAEMKTEPVKMEPAKSPDPMTKLAEDKKMEAAKPAAMGSVVYLASYRNTAAAKIGWGKLAKKSPILAGQEPVMKDVDLGAKGKFVRLYGMAVDDAQRNDICAQLGKMVDECGSKLRE